MQPPRAAGDGLGEGEATVPLAIGDWVGGAAAAGVAAGSVGVVAGTARAVGVSAAETRGAAATGTVVVVIGVPAMIGAGLSAAGGGCVGTITLGVSATSPLHAAIAARATHRHTQRIEVLARDLARVAQRCRVVINSRRSLYRASGLGLNQAATTLV